MLKFSVLGRRSAQAATLALLVACASDGPVGTQAPNPSLVRVELSEMTLSFAYPTALKPSNDFGQVMLVREVDLARVAKPTTVLHGYWDGPRYQLLSVTGTLRVWLLVTPWPAAASAARGCDAKLNALLDAEVQADFESFRRHKRSNPPSMDSAKVSITGRDGVKFKSSYDRGGVKYVFPINGGHVLRLMFTSANNSGLGSEWEALSAREQERFVRSMALSGDPDDCA